LFRLLEIPYLINKERRQEEWLAIKDVPVAIGEILTDEEKNQIRELWGMDPVSYREYEIYKAYNGFDPRFMAFSIYLPLISRRLNNYFFTELYEHKSLLGYLTCGVINFPQCFIRVVDGDFYADDMRQISRNEGLDLCASHDIVVIKDSVGSSGGKGVEILRLQDYNIEQRKEIIEKAISNRGMNFVVQEYLYEHNDLKRFNPTSVNTIRLQTLYLNGKFSIVARILRFGGEGAEVDNACSGGIAVGIHSDGRLYKYGFDNKATRHHSYRGITFEKEVLSFIPKLDEHVKDAHIKQFPMSRYIGWDFMIDMNGRFICIELNSSQNGATAFQLSAGPTFGERTQEVIDYCKRKPFRYYKSYMNY